MNTTDEFARGLGLILALLAVTLLVLMGYAMFVKRKKP